MCQSKAQGGKRCLTHTRQTYDAATQAQAKARQSGGPVSPQAHDRYVRAVFALAEHEAGRSYLTGRSEDIRTRRSSAGGDDLLVIDAALAPHKAAAAEKQARQEAFADAMRGNLSYDAALAQRGLGPDKPRPMSPEDRRRSDDLRAKIAASNEAVADGHLGADDDAVQALAPQQVAPGVTIPAGQESLLRRWGSRPVHVQVHVDRAAQGGGYAEYDLRSGQWVRGDAERGWADKRRHATITTTNTVTRESWAVRAAEDPDTGVWTIYGDQGQRP